MFYLVINDDSSIHTVEEKPYEVLRDGMQRIEIENKPTDAIQHYKWNGAKLVKKTVTEINKINDDEDKRSRKLLKIESQNKISEIEKLELVDTKEDYSEEKAKYQKIINDNLA